MNSLYVPGGQSFRFEPPLLIKSVVTSRQYDFSGQSLGVDIPSSSQSIPLGHPMHDACP